MTGPSRKVDLTDMQGLPMSAGWYWQLAYLRSVLRRTQQLHLARIPSTDRRRPAALSADMIAQRDADAAMEVIDRHMRTMEAAGVLDPNG